MSQRPAPPCPGGISGPTPVGAPGQGTSARNAVPADLVHAVEQYGREHADVYGGVIANHADGVVEVGFTDDPCGHLAALRRVVPAPDVFRVYTAGASKAALDALVARIGTAMQGLRNDGVPISVVNPDLWTQTVLVGLREVTPEAEGRVREVAGPDAGLLRLEQINMPAAR